jgi:hypothetical protein
LRTCTRPMRPAPSTATAMWLGSLGLNSGMPVLLVAGRFGLVA